MLQVEPIKWELTGLIAGLAGLIVAALQPPAPLALTLLGIFVLLGPGSLVQSLVDFPRPTNLLVVPAIGVAVVVLLSSAMAAATLWSPRVSLLVLSALVVAGLLLRLILARYRATPA